MDTSHGRLPVSQGKLLMKPMVPARRASVAFARAACRVIYLYRHTSSHEHGRAGVIVNRTPFLSDVSEGNLCRAPVKTPFHQTKHKALRTTVRFHDIETKRGEIGGSRNWEDGRSTGKVFSGLRRMSEDSGAGTQPGS
eukprot:scaffold14733_cov108-Isochrysis_galbana.AAC.4